MAQPARLRASCAAMDNKDNFMRFVLIGSIVAVGVLAVVVMMQP